jgi:branched-chain amino acid transport system ATP-binding protein
MSPLLATDGLTAHYGDFQALFGIDFEVGAGEVVAIIGANGAGKSTSFDPSAASFPWRPSRCAWTASPSAACPRIESRRGDWPWSPRAGDSFRASAWRRTCSRARTAPRGPWSLARAYELFPVLREKRRAYPRTLSGGEQQMAAIGRALMANPRLLICDELSLGLAPVVVKGLYDALTQVVREGLAVIIVEQDVALAQGMSRRLYCFQEGRVSLRGASSAITRAEITRAYFGV